MPLTEGTKTLMGATCATALLATAAVAWLAHSKSSTPPADLKKAGMDCMKEQDWECAEDNWQQYVEARPTDGTALARLGIVQSHREEDEQAVVNIKKAIDLGEGTYDLFYYYADSLSKLGKTDEAIDWYYKTLTVVPTLVDARGNLAKLLVQKKRYFEALALLASFDDHLVAEGHQAYFEGQRIAIETSMQQTDPAGFEEKAQIRLPKTEGSFYAPVTLGQARVNAFVVDTGAVLTTVSDDFLKQSKAKYEVLRPSVEATTADGRRVKARLLNIDSMKLGAFDLKNVQALACPTCEPLLGQGTLSQFDLASSKVQGVEFLTLKPRKL
jgi:predicted aspartyl protease